MSGHPKGNEDVPPTLRDQGIIAFDVHGTASAGPLPDRWSPEWAYSEVRRARWLLANRLAAELLDVPEASRVAGHDLLSARVISMRWMVGTYFPAQDIVFKWSEFGDGQVIWDKLERLHADTFDLGLHT